MSKVRGPSRGATRKAFARFASPTLFAAILIAFALPFGTVSCEGPPVDFTGYELAAWRVPQTTPPATTDSGESLPDAIESKASFMALVALLAAAAGLALGILRRRGAGITAAIGLVAMLGLFLTAVNESILGPEIEFEVGYAAAAALFIVAAFWHAVVAISRGRRRRAEQAALASEARARDLAPQPGRPSPLPEGGK